MHIADNISKNVFPFYQVIWSVIYVQLAACFSDRRIPRI